MKFICLHVLMAIFIWPAFLLHSLDYDEIKTQELNCYLEELALICKKDKQKPNKDELATMIRDFCDQGANPCILNNCNGTGPIHFAAEAGDMILIAFLLEKGVAIDSSDIQLWTPLMWAASAGEIETMLKLMQQGADIEAKSLDNKTAFMIAMERDKNEAGKKLLEAGAFPYRRGLLKYNQSSILEACFSARQALAREGKVHRLIRLNNNKELVKASLSDIDTINGDGFTPLDIALIKRNKEGIWILLYKGANPRLGTFKPRPPPIKYQLVSCTNLALDYLNYRYAQQYYLYILSPLLRNYTMLECSISNDLIKYIVDIILLGSPALRSNP